MESVNVNDPNLWKTLASIFGPGGLVLLITNAGTAWAVRLMWNRLKEKDEECRTEIAAERTSFMEFRNQLRDDIKQAFGIVATLSEKVTVLVERTTNTRTRSDG